jgi:hypothetical protein
VRLAALRCFVVAMLLAYPCMGLEHFRPMAESDAVMQATRELYGLPPGEFTRARDARVKELRKEGDREAANAVKALRKPTVAAWALNQLSRRRAKDLARLFAAGEELRSAQEELLGGGDRAPFQDAAAAERELVAELSADATTLASEAGERSGGLREKVAETLHAAALDEDTAEELRAGRLTREREAIGGFGEPGGGLAPAVTPPKRPRKQKQGAPRSPARSKSDSENRQRLAAARTDERHARRELDAAVKAVEHAQERAEAARVHAEEAAQRAKVTAERLKEAKKAETAARKAHARAARAIESAGS